MELTQLAYFVAVAEELHFSRAAERLNVSQQPLSRQIQMLEREVGARLFERITRRVELTDAGRLLLEQVRAGLEHLDRGVESARRADRGEIGQLVLGFNTSSMFTVFPPIVRLFRERFPGIWLEFREDHAEALEEQLLAKRIDACLMVQYWGFAEASGLETETVYREPVHVAMPMHHPLAQLPSVPMRALDGQPLVARARYAGARVHDALIARCAAVGFRPLIAQTSTSVPCSLAMVAAGLGMALMAESVIRGHGFALEHRPLTDPSLETDVRLAWRRSDNSPAVRHLIEVAREVAQQSQAGAAVSGPDSGS